MRMFTLFREDGWNTYYDGRNTPASVDVRLAMLAFAGVVMAATLIMVVIGTRGKERWTTFVRLILNLHTGIVILVCLSGRCWLDSHVHTHCDYAAMTTGQMEANIGLQIGLKGGNISMAGLLAIGAMNMSHGALASVAYNEHFGFNKVRGAQTSLHSALIRGLPQPIIYLLDYLAADAGALRWQRTLRMAGHFVYIMLWSAFSTWSVAILVLAFVVQRGAVLLLLSGALMVGACALYHGLHPGHALIIPFQDSFMEFHYGWCFWLCAIFGSVTCAWSLVILLLHLWTPEHTRCAFHVDHPRHDTHSTPSPTRKSPLLIDTPYRERRSMPYLGSVFENRAFLAELEKPRRAKASKIRTQDAHRWSESPQDNFPEGLNLKSGMDRAEYPGVPPGSYEDPDTDCEGSFIDDSISDQMNLGNAVYTASENSESHRDSTVHLEADTCSIGPDTADTTCVFQADTPGICVYQVGERGCRTVIDLQAGDILYDHGSTSC